MALRFDGPQVLVGAFFSMAFVHGMEGNYYTALLALVCALLWMVKERKE